MARIKKDDLDLDPQYPLDDHVEELFCQNYVTNGGVASLALEATGAVDDAINSLKNVQQKAYLWLKRPRIKKRIVYLKAKYSELHQSKKLKLTALLEDILDSEITDFVKQDPNTGEITIKDFLDFPEYRKKAITQIECTKTTRKEKGGDQVTEISSKLRLENKIRAAKIYADITGISTDYSKCRAYFQGIGYDLLMDEATGDLVLEKLNADS